MNLATRRLIDASATLPAADRALLSLWTQRGLDDAALAHMTGVDPATITERRGRIVTGLSTELGLPPQDVASALSAIAQSAAESVALHAAEAASETSRPAQTQATVEPAHPDPEPRPEAEVASVARTRRRRPVLWPVVALLSVAVVAIIVLALSSGGATGRHAPVASAPVTSTSPPGSPPSTASAAPASSPRTLTPLPGGVAGATGVVRVAPGPAGTQRLLVRVSGLPAAGSAHYEVWLYNSIVDSVALGRLGPSGAGSFTLPAVVTRFASIDISLQPPGMTLPSGASMLRTSNPLAAAHH